MSHDDELPPSITMQRIDGDDDHITYRFTWDTSRIDAAIAKVRAQTYPASRARFSQFSAVVNLPDTLTRGLNHRVECEQLEQQLKAITGDDWPIWEAALDGWVSDRVSDGQAPLSARHVSATALLLEAQLGHPLPAPPPSWRDDAEWMRLYQEDRPRDLH